MRLTTLPHKCSLGDKSGELAFIQVLDYNAYLCCVASGVLLKIATC